ncbi:MAG: sel1 repeat family protein [Gammaproteobacteria bacterium]|nr:sel1 repeat family protein [Gammaproteobacteria bacterium]
MGNYHGFSKRFLPAACGSVFLALSAPWAGAHTATGVAPKDLAGAQSADLTTARLENTIGTRCALGDGVPQNYSLAAHWFNKAALHGYAKAEYNLGMQYYFGQGVNKDEAKAAYWWEKAAAQGIPAAQYNLGNLYFLGQGVPQDYGKASIWWRKAAALGNVQASRNLATLARVHPEYREVAAVGEKTVVAP